MGRDTDPGMVFDNADERERALRTRQNAAMLREWLLDPDSSGFNLSHSLYLHLQDMDADDLMEIMEQGGVSALYQKGSEPYLQDPNMRAFLLITNYDPTSKESRPWERRRNSTN